MANIVVYICNQKDPDCCEHCTSGVSECRRTTKSEFALNGPCSNPGAHPDRFLKVGENVEGGENYWEFLDEEDVAEMQWNGPILSGSSAAELISN